MAPGAGAILVGVSGAVFGGFDARSIPAAILGAAILLTLYELISRRTA